MNPEFADLTDEVMLDELERQYECDEPLNAEFVWELLNRDDLRLGALRAVAETVVTLWEDPQFQHGAVNIHTGRFEALVGAARLALSSLVAP